MKFQDGHNITKDLKATTNFDGFPPLACFYKLLYNVS